MAESVSVLVSVAESSAPGAGTALPLEVCRGPPTGLRNLRKSSCYLNSVLQCLTFTSPLAEYCLRKSHSSTCTHTAARDCTFCILEKRIRKSLVSRIPVDAPRKLYKHMTENSIYFEPGRHEDAHELLSFLIEDCGKAFEAEHNQSEVGSRKTVLDGLFGGVLQSHIECRQCHAESTMLEDMFDLNLEICKFSSLVQALACFSRSEVLDGDNKYHCHSCKGLSVARKRMSIHRAPKVLTIQLKRFDPLSGRKLNHHVQFETQLSICDYMSTKLTDLQYTLYGVIVHHGSSLNYGHYVAYVKLQEANGKWYLCDDESVSEVSEKQVLEAKAYLLFYIQREPTLWIQTINGRLALSSQ